MAETPTTRCVECGEPTPDGATYCGRQCRREANRQPAPPPPTPRRTDRVPVRAGCGRIRRANRRAVTLTHNKPLVGTL